MTFRIVAAVTASTLSNESAGDFLRSGALSEVFATADEAQAHFGWAYLGPDIDGDSPTFGVARVDVDGEQVAIVRTLN